MSEEIMMVVGVAVIALIVLIYYANKPVEFKPEPAPPALKPIKADLTLQQLRQFDGQKNSRVMVALRGVIYDVSKSDFYGVGGGYHMFAGHDASINLSKMSHDAEFLNKYGVLTMMPEDEKILDDWICKFEMKYPVVGNVVKPSGQGSG